MANPTFIKTYTAEGAIGAYCIVKPGANDYGVAPSSAVGDALLGVTTEIAAADTERCDVIHNGTALVQLGGTVARGDPITSDASAHGVKAAPVAGTNNSVIGRAVVSGVSGDIIPVLLSIGQIQG